MREQIGAHLVRPDRKGEPARFGRLAGVYARAAQRLLALAAAIWHNWKINAPVKRSLVAYDH